MHRDAVEGLVESRDQTRDPDLRGLVQKMKGPGAVFTAGPGEQDISVGGVIHNIFRKTEQQGIKRKSYMEMENETRKGFGIFELEKSDERGGDQDGLSHPVIRGEYSLVSD
jgi:hypothetical protein